MHKLAIQFGNFSIYWYGVLVAVGFLAGIWTANRRAPRYGVSPETVADLGVWLILGAMLGARGLYVLTYWQEDFAGRPLWNIFNIRQGGLVFYGGFVGASLACIAFTQWKRLSLWKLADVLTPSIALGYFFGRLGCLMNGCCYGKACALPWAIRFPADHETRGAPVHPTQLYESFSGLALYFALAWFLPRKHFDGQVFALYLMANAVVRFTVEFFRGDYTERHLLGWVTPGQGFSLGLMAFALGLYAWLRLRQNRGATPPGGTADRD